MACQIAQPHLASSRYNAGSGAQELAQENYYSLKTIQENTMRMEGKCAREVSLLEGTM